MTLKSLLAACVLLIPFATLALAQAGEAPTIAIAIVTPVQGAAVALGGDAEKSIEVRVRVTGFTLRAAGQCGSDANCGHLHLKIDPEGGSCDIPGRPYNSMNSDTGGDTIQARFGHCSSPVGPHVIGILLARDDHKPVIIDGRPMVATAYVIAK